MKRTTCLVVLLTLLIVPAGCSKVGQAGRVIGKWAKKRPASPAVQPLKTKPVSPAKRQVAAELEQIAARKSRISPRPIRSVAPTAALRSTESLAQSHKLGQRLLGLRPRLPSVVYTRLISQWQRNHAEIETCHARLQDPSLDSFERENLEECLVTATEKNEEIERLVAQYG